MKSKKKNAGIEINNIKTNILLIKFREIFKFVSKENLGKITRFKAWISWLNGCAIIKSPLTKPTKYDLSKKVKIMNGKLEVLNAVKFKPTDFIE